VSTVLKAVQELDRGGAPLTAADIQASDGRRTATVALATGGALLVALVGVVVARRALHPDRTSGPVAAPVVASRAAVAPVTDPVVESPPETLAERPPQAVGARLQQRAAEPAVRVAASAPAVAVRPAPVAALPWARIDAPSVDAHALAAHDDDEAPAVRAPRPAPAPEPKRVAARAPAPMVDAAPARAASSSSSGVPPIDVRAIVFSEDISARKVVLRIGNAPSVTLRQGESSDGIDVQIITERSVYLRHNGNIFSVAMH
jgi:hypothetical protein